jgi:hypothetical protein
MYMHESVTTATLATLLPACLTPPAAAASAAASACGVVR